MDVRSLLHRGVALLIALMAASVHAASPKLLGNMDGIAEDGAGGAIVTGWACTQGVNTKLDVQLWVDGWTEKRGTKLGSYRADGSAEDAIRIKCGTADAAHRFSIPLDAAKRQQYAGRAVFVTAPSDVVDMGIIAYIPLGGSGQYMVPAPRAPSAPQDDTVYVISDRLGSEVILTDSNANVIFNVDYKAYGSAVDIQRKLETVGYTGHYEDTSTGLTYMQARYYDADLARFMSPEPVAARPGDLLGFGRYTYADANPVNFVDPDGRDAKAYTRKYNNGSGGGGDPGTVYVNGFYSGASPSRSNVGIWSNQGGSGRGDGAGSGGGVRTEPTLSVTADVVAPAIPQPLNPPRINVPPGG